MMKVLAIRLSVVMLLVQIPLLYAAKSEVKLTTYYPAPYGNYTSVTAQVVNTTGSLKIPQKVVGNSTATLTPGQPEIWFEG